jgi:DNA-binding LacI/PurR family transcriptional regulator
MASLRDVAARAGVSVATASRVASGSARVRPQTRERVERAMRELLYVAPRQVSASGTIGLVAPGLADPVIPALLGAIEAAATRAGHASILCSAAGSPDRMVEYVHMLVERGVRGIVVVSPEVMETSSRFLRLLHGRASLVYVNGKPPGAHAPSVHVDERAAGRLATEHLLRLGHAPIAFAGGSEAAPSARDRRAGYEAVLLEAGLEPEDELAVHGAPTLEGGREAARRLLGGDAQPTAIVCGNDLIAIGVLREAAARGLRVPEELSVVGFDGLAAWWTQPVLTTVEQPIEQIAETTIAALDTSIEQPDAGLPDYVFRPRLREGGTTAPPAAG